MRGEGIRGLYVAGSGEILERDTHLLEVNLSLGYPRRAPQCRMLTPVFHPNFDDSMVCIGDFWAPSEGLDDLIIRIGRMIAYQEFNTKSPLNGLAAKWPLKIQTYCPWTRARLRLPTTTQKQPKLPLPRWSPPSCPCLSRPALRQKRPTIRGAGRSSSTSR
jgi:hypothetical protein